MNAKNFAKKLITNCRENEFINSALSHGLRYFGVSLITGVVGMLMLKYYSYRFTVEEYGLYSMYLTLSNYIITISCLSIDKNFGRLYSKYKNSEKKNLFINTTLVLLIALLVLNSLILLIVWNFLGYFGIDKNYFLIVISVSFIQIVLNFNETIYYMEQESKIIVERNLRKSFLQHLSSFLLGVFTKLSTVLIFLGCLLSNIAILFFDWNKSRKISIQFNLEIDKGIIKEIFVYTFPLFASTVLSIAFSSMDKIMLNSILGSYSVGIYSLAFNIATVISLFLEAISNSITPVVFEELEQGEGTNLSEIEKFDNLYLFSVVLLSITVAFFRYPILVLTANSNYLGSANVLIFIVFNYAIGSAYKIASLVIGYYKMNWIYPIISCITFVIGFVLNLILIPIYGAIGAAFATNIVTIIYGFLQHWAIRFKYLSLWKILLRYLFLSSLVTLLFLFIGGY